MTRDLALAMIHRAFQDLACLRPGCEYVRIGRYYIRDAGETALAFLTSMDDEWLEWRQFWADRAGLDADVIRRRALAVVEEQQRAGQETAAALPTEVVNREDDTP